MVTAPRWRRRRRGGRSLPAATRAATTGTRLRGPAAGSRQVRTARRASGFPRPSSLGREVRGARRGGRALRGGLSAPPPLRCAAPAGGGRYRPRQPQPAPAGSRQCGADGGGAPRGGRRAALPLFVRRDDCPSRLQPLRAPRPGSVREAASPRPRFGEAAVAPCSSGGCSGGSDSLGGRECPGYPHPRVPTPPGTDISSARAGELPLGGGLHPSAPGQPAVPLRVF